MYPNNPTLDARQRRHGQLQAAIRLVVLAPLLCLWFYPMIVHAQDKSGVKPQVISLPSGPGSLEGLGENFAPNLSTGTSSYPVNFTTAPGRVGFQPQLALNYNGGNANGPWGMGWEVSIPSIQRRTEEGLPTYDDARDQFVFANGEKLVSLKDGSYRFENESTLMRFRRLPDGGWEAQTPDGVRYLFGESENSRVTNPLGIFRWELARIIDPHGNEQHYSYLHDGAYAYPREIRYNFGQDPAGQAVYNAVIFNYAPRPDTYTDRRSGAPIRVGLRGTDIQMWSVGKLVRAYRFSYEPERSTGLYSLLIRVEQVGDDGTSILPPHTFTYTQFDPAAHAVVTMQNPPPVILTNRDADLVDINADGLPDLVYTPEEGQHRFYLNRGHGRWATQPVIPANSPAERLSNPNVRMADMNGDGRVDLLVKASGAGAPLYYYRNQLGADWDAGSPWTVNLPFPVQVLNRVAVHDANSGDDYTIEVRGDQLVKYLFANDERIAEVRTVFDKSRLIRGLFGAVTPQTDNPATTKTLFYHGDHLGSATVVVDPAGQVVERRTYHPFGQANRQAGASVAAYSYTGKELDAGIGLYYYGARYYDPAVGRFISVDPLYFEQPEKDLADPQALNLYAYTRNNPVQNVDPDGQDVVVAYGVGHQERVHRTAARKYAAQIRSVNTRIHVVKATDLQKPSVQQKFADLPVSAVVYVGHGNVNVVGVKAYNARGKVRFSVHNTPERFAAAAGVRAGGVAVFLSCKVVNGQTPSETVLANRDITTIGFDRKLYARSDGRLYAPAPGVRVTGNVRTEPWVQPGAIEPTIQTGPNPIQDGKVNDFIYEAESRVMERPNI